MRSVWTLCPESRPKRDFHESEDCLAFPPSAECKLSAPAEEVEARLSKEG